MSAGELALKIRKLLATPRADGRPNYIVGPGAEKVRAAQGMIRRLAARPSANDGIPARVSVRPVTVASTGDAAVNPPTVEYRAAIANTAPHIRSARREETRLEPRTAESSADSDDTGDGIDDEIRNLTKAMLENAAAAGSALRISGRRVAEMAMHDFAEYRFLRDPNALLGPDDRGNAETATSLEQFLTKSKEVITSVVEAFCQRTIPVQDSKYALLNLEPYFPQFVASIYSLFLATTAGELFEFIATLRPPYTNYSGSARADVLSAFREWLRVLVQNATFDANSLQTSFDHPELWNDAPSAVVQLFFVMFPDARVSEWIADDDDGYGFTPFPPDGINFGLRVMFRQEWRPLGTQPGEIVRTIPLGPKQSEKVTTKTVVTSRTSRSDETSTTSETSNESSNATKDSSDVVREASSKYNWHADVEASGGFFSWSAKASAGAAGEQAASSKDTKTRLNDTMQKTASKMTRNVKVVVSTEQTTTEELQRSSEIVNPNDELAITYVYSKLQRQYEIFTSVAEANTVVFVPERVPNPSEITAAWIRKYDWILEKVLLDESFAEDLGAIAREVPDTVVTDPNGAFKGAADTAMLAMREYHAYTGGTLPDLFSAPQATYARHLEAERANQTDIARRTQRETRLIDHIRQNILHYMRAIWSSEDSDHRMRRYARHLVPIKWDFVPRDPTIDPSADGFVDGEFLPDLSPTSLRPLCDIVNPAGPVGFAGNYAIFLLRNDRQLADLNKALAVLRAYYVKFVVDVKGEGSERAFDAFVTEPRHREATYQLTHRGPGDWLAQLVGKNGPVPVTVEAAADDSRIDVDGVRIRFDPAPDPNVVFTVDVYTNDELQDPEVYQLRRDHELPVPGSTREDGFFSVAILTEMTEYLDDVRSALPADLSGGWSSLDDAAKRAVRAAYYRFLLVRDHTRRFLMETNNLVLDIEVGATPVLEDFKRLHRTIDVLKELEEAARRQLENSRRGQRLSAADLADPDIENVTMVTMPAGVTPAVVVGGGGGGAPGTPPAPGNP